MRKIRRNIAKRQYKEYIQGIKKKFRMKFSDFWKQVNKMEE